MRLALTLGSAAVLVIGGALAGYLVHSQASFGSIAQADIGLSSVYPIDPAGLHSPDLFETYAVRASLDPIVTSNIANDLAIPQGTSPIRFAYAPTSGAPGEVPSQVRITVTGDDPVAVQEEALALARYASDEMANFAAKEAVRGAIVAGKSLISLARAGIPPYLSAIRENEKKQAVLAAAALPDGTAAGRVPGVEIRVTEPRFYPAQQHIVALQNDKADLLAVVSQMETNQRTAAIQVEKGERYLQILDERGLAAIPEIEADFVDIEDRDVDVGVALAPYVSAFREAATLAEAPAPAVIVRSQSSSALLSSLLGAFAGFVLWLVGWQFARFRK